jgi:hypothetical protein
MKLIHPALHTSSGTNGFCFINLHAWKYIMIIINQHLLLVLLQNVSTVSNHIVIYLYICLFFILTCRWQRKWVKCSSTVTFMFTVEVMNCDLRSWYCTLLWHHFGILHVLKYKILKVITFRTHSASFILRQNTERPINSLTGPKGI